MLDMKEQHTQSGVSPIVSVIGVVILLIVVLVLLSVFRNALGMTTLFPFRFGNSSTATLDEAPWENESTTIVETDTKVVVTQDPPGEGGLTIETIQNNMNEYLGQAVTVTGFTSRQVEPWGFTMTTTEASELEMLVLLIPDNVQQNALSGGYEANTAVRVQGTVKQLTTEFEESFGLEPDDISLNPWINQNVIVAEYIDKI